MSAVLRQPSAHNLIQALSVCPAVVISLAVEH